MSYKTAYRQSYGIRKPLKRAITATHHYSFRAEWEGNLEKAIKQAQTLKDQGYLVDECLEKGTFLESQAKKMTERLKEQGCETQLVPVARWAGENVVFIVYKPPKEAEAPSPTTMVKASKLSDSEKLEQRYIKLFWAKGTTPDLQTFATKGYLINPKRVLALIKPNAPAQDEIVKMLREEQAKGVHLNAFENNPKLQAAVAKNLKARTRYVVFDSQGKVGVRLDYFRDALKTLGKCKLRVYSPAPDKPLYLVREDDYAMGIAPAFDLDVTEAVTLDSLLLQSQTP